MHDNLLNRSLINHERAEKPSHTPGGRVTGITTVLCMSDYYAALNSPICVQKDDGFLLSESRGEINIFINMLFKRSSLEGGTVLMSIKV